jgi:phosphoribosylformimino-5-aminoimidazole carboxamide ribotide isomerase
MRILPVIDLLAGKVVRGVAGDRAKYAPIASRLSRDTSPAAVAKAFVAMGFSECYLADLEAIAGKPPDLTSYAAIRSSGLNVLWIDAGVRHEAGGLKLANSAVDRSDRIVIGLESLQQRDDLKLLVERLGSDRFAFSLDLKAGRPLAAAQAWRDIDPLEIARDVIQAGVRRMIVLDLANVGVASGVGTEKICRGIRTIDDRIEMVAGGGIRNVEDLQRLANWGCNAALVASALHDGKITADELGPYIGSSKKVPGTFFGDDDRQFEVTS